MADNYLENQYEQYRARKAAWEKAKKSGKAQTLHKPTLPLKKDPCTARSVKNPTTCSTAKRLTK